MLGRDTTHDATSGCEAWYGCVGQAACIESNELIIECQPKSDDAIEKASLPTYTSPFLLQRRWSHDGDIANISFEILHGGTLKSRGICVTETRTPTKPILPACDHQLLQENCPTTGFH
jgi:hypothetical protein